MSTIYHILCMELFMYFYLYVLGFHRQLECVDVPKNCWNVSTFPGEGARNVPIQQELK